MHPLGAAPMSSSSSRGRLGVGIGISSVFCCLSTRPAPLAELADVVPLLASLLSASFSLLATWWPNSVP